MLNFYFEQNEELFDGADKFDFVADLMAMDLPLPADYESKSYKVADCFAPPEKDFAVKDKTFGYTVEGEASKFKDFCNRYSISAQRAGSFLLAKAIQMTHPENKKVINVRGPVDTRNILQTPNTFQNASVPHIFLNIDPAWLGDALPEEAIRSVAREFNEQYTYENLAAYTNWCRRGIISPDEGERQNIFMSCKKQTDIFANYVGTPIDKNLLICKFRGQVQMTVNEKQTENTRRFISTKNLKVLGKGASAVIYELSEDKILKAFTTHYTESMLLEEFRLTKAVYDAGIRTMKAYEVVETDEFLGCVYERLVLCQDLKQIKMRIL